MLGPVENERKAAQRPTFRHPTGAEGRRNREGMHDMLSHLIRYHNAFYVFARSNGLLYGV